MRIVHWNILARQDFNENINYLIKNWSDKEAQNFIDKVFEIETLLSIGNIEFQDTDRAGIKRCVINKHISLYYRIIDKKNIELLRFWNNSQNLGRLNL